MPLSPRIAARLQVAGTVVSALLALASALAMRDRVRLVDILALFFGGLGAGAGLTALAVQHRLAARSERPTRPHRPPVLPRVSGLHTPPTVPWRTPASPAAPDDAP